MVKEYEMNGSNLCFGCNVATNIGIFLVDDRQTPPPQKCPFSEIDFLDVSDDFKKKKNPL